MGLDDINSPLKNDILQRYIYDHLSSIGDTTLVKNFSEKFFEIFITQYLSASMYSKPKIYKTVDFMKLENLDFLTVEYEIDQLLPKPAFRILFLSIFLSIFALIMIFYIANIRKYIKKLNKLIS